MSSVTQCLGCRRPIPVGRSRCPLCERAHDRERGTRQKRGYDAAYQRERAELIESNSPCFHCGERTGTTADHVPALANYPDVAAWRAAGGVLVPCCPPCNYRRGGATRRKARTP